MMNAWMALILSFAIILTGCLGTNAKRTSSTHSDTSMPEAAGYLEGTVWFVGLPCRMGGTVPPCEGPYPGYRVAVYESDGKTVAGEAITSARGNYFIGLPAGNYIVYEPTGPSAQKTHAISIVAAEVTALDIKISTGIASESAPQNR